MEGGGEKKSADTEERREEGEGRGGQVPLRREGRRIRMTDSTVTVLRPIISQLLVSIKPEKLSPE